MANLPPLKDFIAEANKVWEKMHRFLPFTDKDAYIAYVKEKYKELKNLSSDESKKYIKQQEDLIKEGIKRIENSDKCDDKARKFTEKGEHPND